ncbi:hypothetical protein COU00_02590, partial [Candidatus Falkowbacteria bacterium CG10_big_fil_rev_8_21_14_0_10_43_11]
TMMNKRFDWMCADERRHLYYNLLQYWHGILKKYQPDMLIFSSIPHAPYEYVVYNLARLLNIKTFMFYDTLIPDRLLFYNDFWRGSTILQEKLASDNKEDYALENLSGDLREYYQLQTNPEYDSTPVYIKAFRKQNTAGRYAAIKIRTIITSLKDFSIFRKVLAYFLKLFGPNVKKEYHELQTKPDLNKKFIYAPLNYQPECTTSPQAGIFVDQILMIETLAASIPESWFIYVKEHPTQWAPRGLNYFSSRYRGYYRRLAKIKNVVLIPTETDTYELMKKTQAVATATGTAGWESVLRLKPAIVFGYPWYRDCPGVFKVNDAASCQKAIKEINNGYRVSQQQIINYFQSFDEATIRDRYFISGVKGSDGLNRDKSIGNIIQTVLMELKKYS